VREVFGKKRFNDLVAIDEKSVFAKYLDLFDNIDN
jgi:hypothetical protein